MSDLLISSGSYAYQLNSQNTSTVSQSLYGGSVSDTNNGGHFSTTVGRTLAQIGASLSSTASGSALSTQSSPESLGSFLHNMFAALQLQSETTSQKNSSEKIAVGETIGFGNITSSSSDTVKNRYFGSGATSATASKLLNLSQQISSSSSSDPALDTLQQHFQGLVGFRSQSGNQSTLGNFLQALSKNLQGASPVGNFIQTQV